MDCGRRSAVDDDRSRKIRLAVDDNRRQGRWAVDDARSRIAFYQAQSKESLDRVDKNLDRIRENLQAMRRIRMSSATIPRYSSSSISSSPSRIRHQSHHTPAVVDDYPPLELPLRWREPPPLTPDLTNARHPPLQIHSNPSRDHTRNPDPLHQDFTAATPFALSLPLSLRLSSRDSNSTQFRTPPARPTPFSPLDLPVVVPVISPPDSAPTFTSRVPSGINRKHSSSRRPDADSVPDLNLLGDIKHIRLAQSPSPPHNMPALTDDSSPPDRTVHNHHSAVIHDSSLSLPLLLSSAHIPLPCIQSSGSPSTPTPSPISSSTPAQPIKSIAYSSIKELEEEMEKLHEQRAVVIEERRAADITDKNVGLEAAVSAARSVLDRGSTSAPIAAATIEAQASLTTGREISSLPVQLDDCGRDANLQKHMDFVGRADAKKCIKVQAKAKRLSFIAKGVDESQQIEGDVSSDESDSEISAYRSSRNELLQTVEQVFSNAVDKYSKFSIVKERLERWKKCLLPSYQDAYISLSAPYIFSNYVRLEVLKWDPLYKTMDFFDMDTARNLFEQMPVKNTHSYIAMITAYTHNGFIDEAKALFHLMRDICNGRHLHPNHTTIATIVSAFAQSESPSRARFLQVYIGHHGTDLLNDHSIAALIDLHSKCKNIDKSYNLFCRWKQKELVCYSAVIDGRGIHKCIAKEIKLFEEIQEANSNEHPITELYINISFLSIVGHGVDFRTYYLFAKNSYSPTHWQIKILVQFNDSKAEHSHLKWEKPLHVLILKSAFKVFDPGICLSPYLPSN